MPSAKSRAAKAAIAARVAAANAAAEANALAAAANANGGVVPAGMIPTLASVGSNAAAIGNTTLVTATNANTPLQPALPSMLNLNTKANLNRALSIGAVVGSRGGVLAGNNGAPMPGSTSDEENVQPPSLAQAYANATGGGVDAMMSASMSSKADTEGYFDLTGAGYSRPSSPPLSPMLGGGNGKDLRAYELDRQRHKRAGELAKRKVKKANAAAARATMLEKESGKAHAKGKGLIGGDSMDVDDVKTTTVSSVSKKGGFAAWFGGGGAAKEPAVLSSSGGQVNLSDLIVPSTRKPRKGKDDDFEIVPSVRRVIVLDDGMDVRDMEIDEPWEHIDGDFELGEGGKHGKEPSYAAVLAGGH